MRIYTNAWKQKTTAQLENLSKARAGRKNNADKENIPISKHKLEQLTSTVSSQKVEISLLKKKFGNEQREAARSQKAKNSLKVDLKKKKTDLLHLELQKKASDQQAKSLEEMAGTLSQLYQAKISKLQAEKSEIIKKNNALKMQVRRLEAIKKITQERAYRSALRKGTIFWLKLRGVYSPRARQISWYLVSKGMPEREVGAVIQEVGGLMGLHVKEKMST